MSETRADAPVFTTKVAIVIRDDLAVWQKLNVAAFLATGIAGAHPEMLGDLYRDGAGNVYHRLAGQPIIVLAADARAIAAIYQRALGRQIPMALYIEDMFRTGHDAANRATVTARTPDTMNVVGLALRDERKVIDRITKGAKLHS
jgi:hypothetical protein